jgi:TolA-binding protein
MIRRLCILVLIAAPVCAFAASKEIQELQREVGLLQDAVKQLQQSQDKQLAALGAQMQLALDAANRADKSVAVIQSSFQQSGNQLKTDVVGPVVGLSTRMDQVTNSVSTLQQAVSDLTSSLNRIQAQLTDVGNSIKVLQTPPPPPPPSQPSGAGGNGTTPASDGTAASSVPPFSATELYNNARADHQSGKLELALQEYASYLKYFGNTNFAPYAQFYIGSIHYSQKQYETAAADFDTLLEKYPDTPNISPQAHWYKGKSLVALGKRTSAIGEFNDVIKKYPSSDTAVQACSDLKDLGMHCPPATTHPAGKRKD